MSVLCVQRKTIINVLTLHVRLIIWCINLLGQILQGKNTRFVLQKLENNYVKLLQIVSKLGIGDLKTLCKL